MNSSEQARTLSRIVPGMETSDGAGVKLRRSIGSGQAMRFDPFLMLDEFGTDNPDDYIAGFPPHPHRGFETVTYMIDGHMMHEDHLGNVGHLKSGGVQWMTAGRGVIHSEMPQQDKGRMRGFQLWINLPASEKMKPASYLDIPADDLPEVDLDNGVRIKLIAGQIETADGQSISGPVNQDPGTMTTDPLFIDLTMPAGTSHRLSVPAGHNALIYAYEGSVTIGGKALPTRSAGLLGDGDFVEIDAGPEDVRLILIAGRPLGEPVVQYGPFVMNTSAQIEQALDDYRHGRLTA